jgi:hypothetical protein
VTSSIKYSTDKYGRRWATVALCCDHCGHTGTTTFYREKSMNYWGRDKLLEDQNGRGGFNQSEMSPYIGNTYCVCIGELVFDARRLPTS